MAKGLLETMEKSGLSKEKAIGALIMAFGIVMFIAGVNLGEYAQYRKDAHIIDNYEDTCLCTVPFIVPKLIPQVNEEFQINVSGGGK